MMLWAVYPRGDKIDAGSAEAVAFFVYREAAMKYCKELWHSTGEVLPIDADQIQYEVEEQ